MKRIKIVLLMILVLLVSGCSVKYNLTINDDKSVNEEVIAEEYTKRMNLSTGLSDKESIDYLYNLFNRVGLKTKITSKKDGNLTIATVKGYHDSLDDYVDNFNSDIVKQVNMTKKDNIVTLRFKQSEVLSTTSSKGFAYNKIKVSIEVPFKVVDHNATSIQKNIYSWEIKEDEPVKEMMISFDEYLETHGSLTYTNVGTSMLPLLRQGKDHFTVERKGAERCKAGDVVLYRRPPDRYVLHRVVEVRPDDYVILGDNCVAKEYGIKDEDILGVMTGYVRDGKTHSVTEPGYQRYTSYILHTIPLRTGTKKAVSRIKGAIRKLIK